MNDTSVPWVRIERLDLAVHGSAIQRFSSGNPDADRWLHDIASHEGRVATHVCVTADGLIAAYCALKMSTIDTTALSSRIRRSADIVEPASLICWIALDAAWQHRGFLKPLIHVVFRLCVEAADLIPYRFILLDAYEPELIPIYQRFGFTQVGATRRMITRVSAVRLILERESTGPEV